MIRLAATTALAVVASMPVHAAEPVVKTARWVASDPSIPHDTFAYRSITLKGTSSIAGQNIRATWDFGDNTDPASFTVVNGYDVSARHVYYASPGTVFTARLTVVDTETGESGSATYLVEMREKTLDTEVNVAIDEGLWYLYKSMQQDSANASNLLAFERNGHLESGDSANPYTEIVARGLKALRQVKSPTPDVAAALAAATNQKNPNATTTTLPAATVSQPSRDRQGTVSDVSGLLQILQLTDRAAQLPDWYSAEVTKGDPADGIARTLVNRQQDDGSWTGHSSDLALETSASLRVLNASPSVNVLSSSVTNVSSKVSAPPGSFPYYRSTGTWNGTITVTNTSGSTITGPLSVGFANLTAGVTLVSPMSATFNGAPYIALTGTDMIAGQVIMVPLKFSNPAKGPIVFSPTTYSGTMPPSALTITCPANTATVGTPYSSAYTASGGVLAYTFSTPAGSLPHNLTLDPVTGNVTGTPDTVQNPTFTAQVTDSAGGTPQTASDATCHINVTSGNQAPTAVGQSTSTNEDIAKLITLTGTDPDGNALTFTIVTPPSNGMLGMIGNPNCVGNPSTCTASVTYTPNANTSGTDSFTFKVNDGTVDSSPATVGITINFVNDAPSFTKGADQSANKGAGAQSVPGWATAISPGPGSNEAGQTVHFNITGNTSPAIFSVAPAVSPTGTLTYTPSATTTGVSTITLNIQDNGGMANGGVDTSAPQTFVITVTDPPQISSANSVTFQPGKLNQSFTVTTTGSPTGASMVIGETGTLPTGVMFTDNHDGTATINGTPASGTQGNMGNPVSQAYPLTLSANNGVPPPASQAFTLNITCPAINVTSAPTAGNLSLVFNVAMATNTYSQANGNGITGWTITGQPAGLSIGAANGQLTGTPTQTGTFSATVTFTDAGACTGTKAVTIAVAPVANNDSYNGGMADNTQAVVTGGSTASPATPFVTLTGFVTANDLPMGGVMATPQSNATTSAGGKVTLAADGTFIYTPPARPALSAITSDSFTYTVTSNTGGGAAVTSAPATVTLTLAGRVWYVKGGGSDSNTGQSQAPFLTLSKAIAVSTANDTIYLYSGNDANLATASVLQTGQSLIGEGVALVVNGNTLVAAGSTPLIGNTVTLNTNTTARGFNLSTGGNTGMNDPGSGITGVTVNTVSVTTTTGTGVNLSDIAGTLSFTGLTTTGGAGATLTGGNSGATFTFTGVSVSSGASSAFNATGGGTLTITGAANTLTSTTGTALNVANTTIGAGGITFRSISSNGAANGISLTNTGGGSFITVAGNGGTCSTSANCTGGAILNSTNAVLLSGASNVSIDRMFIQNSSDSGIKGTNGNSNFSFTNGVIDNSGTGGAAQTSNIAFNAQSVGTENNLSGTVTITGNTLTNARVHGVSIFNFAGTIGNATISNNTLTSSAVVANSQGTAIQFVAFGSGGGAASITKATLDNNIINNFPSARGIDLQCGNANSSAAPSVTCGTPGNVTNIINITNNQINKPGNGSTVKTGGEGMTVLVNGVGQGNFNISSNNVQQNVGISISHSAFGNAVVTSTINSNTIVSNNTLAAQGIGVGTSTTGGFATNSPHMTVTIDSNNVSQTDGNGILAVARDSSSGKLDVTIKSNTVAAPLTGVRPGIRIDAGNATSNHDDVCLDIASNTSAGSGNPASTKQPGIGLRRDSGHPNAFGIKGMTSATATPDVENFVNGQNPGSAGGGPTSGAVGGTVLISAASGFSSCSTSP